MIADLKPYAEYEESGLPWLGKVPAHWGLVPNRGLVRRRKVLVGNRHSDYRLLSLTKQGVIIRDLSTGKGKFSSDMGTSQEVREGDIVFCLFDVPETPRTVGLSRYSGMITGAYTVFEFLGSSRPEYFESFYKAMDDRKLLGPLYSGLRNTIPAESFLGTKTPLPPPEEQAAIVRFLDWANGRLERAIRAKRKVIALLNEQKQAIIHRAVTRGLDPSVPLKPSGIPCFGEIPVHWEVGTIGGISALIQTGPFGSQLHSHEYVAAGTPVINPSHMAGGRLKPSSSVTITTDKAQELTRHKLRAGDIVIARRGDLGRCAIVTNSEEGWICGTGSLLLRCRMLANPDFFQMVFSSRGIADMLSLSSIGATMANLNASVVARQHLPLPPPEEQEEIVLFVRGETKKVNTAISRLDSEITLLREYRTRLVADVVTGKLDVREAVVRLPDEELLPDLAAADDETDDLPIEGEDDA
jgi:type I restriction enzyme S subunit